MRDKILGGVSFSPHRYFNMHVLKNSTLWKFTCFDKLSGLKYTRLTFNKTKYDDVPELVMSSSTISRIQVVLLRVSSLLRSNHQATAKIDGYNQRYRENRTKNTRRGGAWRAWCVMSDRSLDLMIWSNPAFQLGFPPSRVREKDCDHLFPVGAHSTSSPGLFP